MRFEAIVLRFFLICIIVLLICCDDEASSHSTLSPGEQSVHSADYARWVGARSGLNARNKPTIDTAVVCTLPYLSKVHVIGEMQKIELIDNISARWVQIDNPCEHTEYESVYIFSGYLMEQFPMEAAVQQIIGTIKPQGFCRKEMLEMRSDGTFELVYPVPTDIEPGVILTEEEKLGDLCAYITMIGKWQIENNHLCFENAQKGGFDRFRAGRKICLKPGEELNLMKGTDNPVGQWPLIPDSLE